VKENDDSSYDELDLNRVEEAFRHHLKDVMGVLDAIRRIKVWRTPQAVAGFPGLVNLGGTLEPTANGAGKALWHNAVAILRNAGRPMSVTELADAMRTSGVVTKSADFGNTLNSVLTKRKEIFRRVSPKVWGLIEWDGEAVAPLQAVTGRVAGC
jgi:hypothetical protein